MHPNMTDINSLVRHTCALDPAAARTAGAVNGNSIDRLVSAPDNGGADAVATALSLGIVLGATTGGPTALSISVQMQESSDNDDADAWEDVGSAQVVTSDVTANDPDDDAHQLRFDVLPAERYVRFVYTIAFTAGTTPAVFVASDALLGGNLPTPTE